MENKETDNFQNTVFPLGNIKEGVSYQAFFAKKPGAKRITSMAAGCGCTTLDDGVEGMRVTYTSGPIAPELIEKGQFSINVTKTVTITFEDNTSEVLTITATIFH